MYARMSFLYRLDKLFRTFPNLNGKQGTIIPSFKLYEAVTKQIFISPSRAFQLCPDHNKSITNSTLSKAREDSLSVKSNNPDEFGNLSNEPASLIPETEEEAIEEQYVTNPVFRKRKPRLSEYIKLIKEHLDKKEIDAAIDVVNTRMKDDRVKPTSFILKVIISGCGKNGEVHKAYLMYRKMLDYGLKVPDGVYTALFNACATCTNPDLGLRKAEFFRSKMIEKGVEPNHRHYHAMVKAFGRCGDLHSAFQIVDVMVDKGLPIYEETCNFLLHACITDQKSGFRFALLVWHKMLQKKITPTIFTFNLLLRATRDCGVGEPEDIKTTLQQLVLPSGVSVGEISSQETNPELFSVTSSLELQLKDSPLSDITLSCVDDNFPDLLSPRPRLGNFASVLDLNRAHHRLALLGGSRGFLRYMAKYGVNPSMKTYTVLLDCIPPTLAAEKDLLSTIKKAGLKLDTTFCNMLIKRRSFRYDFENAKDVLSLLRKQKLYPDLITFGVLALSCRNLEEAEELIMNMKVAGYRCNTEILGAMTYSACSQHNFHYLMKILYLSTREEVEISPEITKQIDSLIVSSRDILRRQKNGEEIPKSLLERPFKKEFVKFLYKYKAWQEEKAVREKTEAAV